MIKKRGVMFCVYSSVHTAIIHGIDSLIVETEADISDGMPMFELVGYLSSEVREARDRVRTALKNSGYSLPGKENYGKSVSGKYPKVRFRI